MSEKKNVMEDTVKTTLLADPKLKKWSISICKFLLLVNAKELIVKLQPYCVYK